MKTIKKKTTMIRIMLIWACISFGFTHLWGQINLDSVINQYEFINKSSSVIDYPENLSSFRKSIKDFNTNNDRKINILHIGDSHVQAGSYSEPLMREFQSIYGNSGRGILFPYQAAGTNGPSDYAFTSNQKWLAKRNALNKVNLPTGISGHSIYNKSRQATLDFRFRDSASNNFIERITIFHASVKDSNYVYHLQLPEYKEPILRNEQHSNNMYSVYILPEKTKMFTIKVADSSKGLSSTIFGVMAKRNNKGVILHSIGVNGAEYQHYLKSEYFFKHLDKLSPDLIILSLGTNEAYNTLLFNPLLFNNVVDSFFTILKNKFPNASVIITSAPAFSMRVRNSKSKTPLFRENKNVAIVNDVLKFQASKHNLCFWDFYAVMGGFNSMNKWAAAGMTDKRRIHFSRKGYNIQGQLLFKAILNEISE